jgi:copper(I)-binding protein
MRLPRLLLTATVAVFALSASAQDYTAGDLKIGHPWARKTAPGQLIGGAYVVLRNTGSTPERLLGGSTPVAERVELHSMSMEGNVMKMREVSSVDIAPGQTVELKPGQYHLMLVGLKAPLKAGDRPPLTLRFEKAGDVKVDLTIEDGPSSQPASSHPQ